MREGRGKYIWADEDEYIGDWKLNKRDGYGLYI